MGDGQTKSTDAERHVKRKSCELDFDTLDCLVCLEHLSPPVYQCENGHSICATCCKKQSKKGSPSCSTPIGSTRNLTVEKILDSRKVRQAW